jgi:NADPH:quinone reductase-like Zn-dependent oxidoreductase
VQLAAMAGADVVAIAGSPERAEGLPELGASRVVIGDEDPGRDFDLILESVAGASLTRSLAAVARFGTVVFFGASSEESATVDARWYGENTGARLYGLRLWEELARHQSGRRDLSLLARLVGEDRLDTQVSLTADWRDPLPALEALMARRVRGKAVLTIS